MRIEFKEYVIYLTLCFVASFIFGAMGALPLAAIAFVIFVTIATIVPLFWFASFLTKKLFGKTAQKRFSIVVKAFNELIKLKQKALRTFGKE